MRIGQGYDVHRLVPNRKLILGGVEIPYEQGLLGHSDADVLVHAIMDGLLGALALGDIGKHFPPSDLKYKDISSLELLKHVVLLISDQGYEVANIDSIIMAERPKMRDYIDEMRQNMAGIIGIGIDCISIKATTTEGLGSIGRGEGISASAVVLLIEK